LINLYGIFYIWLSEQQMDYKDDKKMNYKYNVHNLLVEVEIMVGLGKMRIGWYHNCMNYDL